MVLGPESGRFGGVAPRDGGGHAAAESQRLAGSSEDRSAQVLQTDWLFICLGYCLIYCIVLLACKNRSILLDFILYI